MCYELESTSKWLFNALKCCESVYAVAVDAVAALIRLLLRFLLSFYGRSEKCLRRGGQAEGTVSAGITREKTGCAGELAFVFACW